MRSPPQISGWLSYKPQKRVWWQCVACFMMHVGDASMLFLLTLPYILCSGLNWSPLSTACSPRECDFWCVWWSQGWNTLWTMLNVDVTNRLCWWAQPFSSCFILWLKCQPHHSSTDFTAFFPNSWHHRALKVTWVTAAYLRPTCCPSFFLAQRWCHKQRLPEHRVHSQRPVSNTGLSSKQAVAMATAASGHVSAFLDVVVLKECEDARVCTRVPV